MKKYFFLLLLILLAAKPVWAEKPEKTILFLVPFYSSNYDPQQVNAIREYEDINRVKSFQLMGFWAGAQLAINEYAQADAPLKIIVRDVSEKEAKLRAILEDRELMERVDLIIGPFFSKSFAIAAKYAEEYQIPIVNPFSSRIDFLKGNEYVFKLVPSIDARPATLTFFADQFPSYQIYIWGDTLKNNHITSVYTRYFNENQIPYKIYPSYSNIIQDLKPTGKNIVLSMSKETAKTMMFFRDLVYSNKLDNLVLVMPEEMLQSHTMETEYFSKLNVHYFSDYYVDVDNENTQVFTHNYIERFKTPPTLDNFAFQGYDITRFFVEWLLNEKDLDKVKVEPLAYRLSFDKIPDGGYENINVQFLEVKDNEIHQAGY